MRSFVVANPGGPDAILAREVATPQPGPGEVRIRTVAAAVNPVDLATRAGMFHELGWIKRGEDAGLGWDIAGYVDAAGEGVAGFAPGDAVAGLRVALAAPLGAYADALVLAAGDVAHLPPGLGFAEAATLPLNTLTADQALDLLAQPEGASLLVTGAAGAVGGFAVALAARRGLVVTGLARARDADFVRAAGARHHVTELTPSTGPFDGVLDAASLAAPALAAVREGGRYLGVLPAALPTSPRPISIQAVNVKADGKRLANLLKLAAEGVLAPRIARLLPLAEAAEAHRIVEAGGQRGRVVLVA